MTKETKINRLIPDDKNFNQGTQYGQHLIEESLRRFGAGRSVLLDKNNRIIAGNKTIENAAAIGMEDVIVVETTGNKIVAVKRTDIDLDTREGRELALADNATSAVNLRWDEDALKKAQEDFGIAPTEWGVDMATIIDPDDFFEQQPQENPVINEEKITIVLPEALVEKKAEITNVIREALVMYDVEIK